MANKQISGLTQKPTPVAATDQFAIDDSLSATYKVTASNILTYINANASLTGAALTKTDDTNVTLTLGGTPATALLRATSLTLGWTGQLSSAKGGTGIDNGSSTITLGGSITTVGKFDTLGSSGFDLAFTLTGDTSLTLPTSGTLVSATGTLTTGSVLFGTSGLVDQDNANFFWDSTNHVLSLGTNTVNSSAQIRVAGTKGAVVYDESVKDGSISGAQMGWYDRGTYASTSSYARVATVSSNPFVSTASGETVTTFGSFISEPLLGSNVGTITRFAGFIFLAGGTSGAGGNIPAAYGGYFETPLSGTARAGLYAGNAAIGSYTATSAPSNGLIVSGNTSIGSSTATSLFNVGSSNQFQIGTTGIVTSGTWNAGVIPANYGGTGVANLAGSTITLGGALSTIGAFTAAFTMTGNTAVTFPTSGTLATVGGTVASATGTANQIAVSASTGAVTFSLTNGISLGSYQATTPPTGGMLIPGNVSIGKNSATSLFNVGANNEFQVTTEGFTSLTGSNSSGFTFQVSPTINAGSNVVVTPVVINPTINANSVSPTYFSAVEISPTMTVNTPLTIPVAYSQYLKTWSTTGTGTITKLVTLRVEPPTGGASNYSAEFTGATYFGGSNQSNFSTTGVLTSPDAAPSILIGTSTAATSTLATFSSATQARSRLALTGQEFFQAANTSSDGLAMLIGVNRSGNKQLWLADSAALTQNSTNKAIRLGTGTSVMNFIDSVATDGTTALSFAIQTSGGKTAIGSNTSPTSNLEVRGTASAFTDYGMMVIENSGNNGLSFGFDTGTNTGWIFSRSVGTAGRPLNLNNAIFCAMNPTNVSFFNSTGSFGGGDLVIFISNANAVPTTNPSGGGVLYVQSGALKYKGSSGTVTTLGNA